MVLLATVTILLPNDVAPSSIDPKLSVNASTAKAIMLLSMSNGPASITAAWNLNTASFIIEKLPSNANAISAAMPCILIDPSRNPSIIKFLDCSAEYWTPSWNPSIALIPRSLNKSAEEIPAANVLCNCSAAVTKSKPPATAMSPVIANNSLSCSVESATLRSKGAAAAISSN